jgi:6-phosphogluconolactonase
MNQHREPQAGIALVPFGSAAELATAAADESVRAIQAGLAQAGRYAVALSGGRIARLFLAELAALPDRELFWSVHWFWGDERCVPPTDPESNFRLAEECLLRPLGISPGQIHRIKGELAPEAAAREAAREIGAVVPAGAEQQPVLDLVILGMGEDGHVASLFPGEAEAEAGSSATYRAVVAAKPPPHRVTLGYPALSAARQVLVLASGSGKAAALAESLAPEGKTPLARVLRSRSYTRVLTDVAAR